MDAKNIISFTNKKKNLLNTNDENMKLIFCFNNYVTRFPENQSESRIVQLIFGLECLV